MESKLAFLATKQDMQDVKQYMKDKVNRLEIKMGENKSEVIKWMLFFWITQLAAMFGFLLLFLKK